MTVVEPKALRTSRIATEAIHSSLPAIVVLLFFSPLMRIRAQPPMAHHKRQQIMVPAPGRKQA
jgi:hypothetical protein